MPIDPNEVIRFMERSLGMIPGAVIVIALLAGPTLLWLLYRFVVQPRTSRYAGGDGGLLWVCTDCRSANDVRFARCYRCGLEREEMDHLQVYDGEVLVTLTEGDADWEVLPTAPPVPVMASGAGSAAAPAVEATLPPSALPPVPTAIPVMQAPARPRRLRAVGPGKPGAKPGAATTKRSRAGGAAQTGDLAEPGTAAETGTAVAIAEPADEALDTPPVEA